MERTGKRPFRQPVASHFHFNFSKQWSEKLGIFSFNFWSKSSVPIGLFFGRFLSTNLHYPPHYQTSYLYATKTKHFPFTDQKALLLWQQSSWFRFFFLLLPSMNEWILPSVRVKLGVVCYQPSFSLNFLFLSNHCDCSAIHWSTCTFCHHWITSSTLWHPLSY